MYFWIQNVCLARLGRSTLLRTAATTANSNGATSLPLGRRAPKLEGPVDPELVEPVLKWLADDKGKQPFIPVEGSSTLKHSTILYHMLINSFQPSLKAKLPPFSK